MTGNEPRDRRAITRAYSVHLLTASGAVFAMLALLSAVAWEWPIMFLWLLAAFAVDGIDGPLARRFDVWQYAGRIDGALLDLIVDFLTYVFIPAFALFQSELVPGLWGWAALVAIIFFSGLYFAGDWMKTEDKSFLGFPGCWNMVVLVFFAVTPPVWVMVLVIAVLTPAMFLPLKFIHPTRTKRWRLVTLPVAIAWTVLAFVAAWENFAPGVVVTTGVALTSLYLLLAGIAQQAVDRLRG